MNIREIRIFSFGKISRIKMELVDNVNVINGTNETGRSTIAAFIYSMFIGLEKPKVSLGDDIYTAYYPARLAEDYGGSIVFEHEEKLYRLTRNFHEKNKKVELFCISDDYMIPDADKTFKDFLVGASKNENISVLIQENLMKVYGRSNTASRSLAESTGAERTDINVSAAIGMLETKKRAIARGGVDEKLNNLEKVISEEKAAEKSLDRLARRIKEEQDKLAEVERQCAEADKPTEFERNEKDFLEAKDSFATFKQATAEMEKLSGELESTIKRREELDKNAEELDAVKKKLEEIQSFKKSNIEESESCRQDIQNMNRRLLNQGKSSTKKQYIFLIAAVVLLVAGIAVIAAKAPMALAILCFIGATVTAGIFGINFVHSKKSASGVTKKIDSKKERYRELEATRESFLKEHGDEEKLKQQYDRLVKESSERAEVIKKEEELSKKLSNYEKELDNKKNDILEAFNRFGKLENLREDELKLLEESLADEKAKANEKRMALREEKARLENELRKLNMELSEGEKTTDKLTLHNDEKKELEDRQNRNKDEIAAVELAAKTIEKLDKEMKENGSGEEKEAEKSEPENPEINTDDMEGNELAEAIGLSPEKLNQYILDVKKKRGDISQMKLSLRLASSDMVLAFFDMPLVFYDMYEHFEDDRMSRVLREICERDMQKIIICGRSKIEKLLDEMEIKYKLIRL